MSKNRRNPYNELKDMGHTYADSPQDGILHRRTDWRASEKVVDPCDYVSIQAVRERVGEVQKRAVANRSREALLSLEVADLKRERDYFKAMASSGVNARVVKEQMMKLEKFYRKERKAAEKPTDQEEMARKETMLETYRSQYTRMKAEIGYLKDKIFDLEAGRDRKTARHSEVVGDNLALEKQVFQWKEYGTQMKRYCDFLKSEIEKLKAAEKTNELATNIQQEN